MQRRAELETERNYRLTVLAALPPDARTRPEMAPWVVERVNRSKVDDYLMCERMLCSAKANELRWCAWNDQLCRERQRAKAKAEYEANLLKMERDAQAQARRLSGLPPL